MFYVWKTPFVMGAGFIMGFYRLAWFMGCFSLVMVMTGCICIVFVLFVFVYVHHCVRVIGRMDCMIRGWSAVWDVMGWGIIMVDYSHLSQLRAFFFFWICITMGIGICWLPGNHGNFFSSSIARLL